MRDIVNYSEKYAEHSFEEYKVFYRRRKILEIIDKVHPRSILEIGCGSEPLFLYVNNVDFTVVEASPNFYENAVKLAKDRNETITIINGFFEEVASKLSNQYDMIICASLLHEVEQPSELLGAIVGACNENTIVNIIVPNANSMHRLLGKEMGILADVHDMTRNNKDFQQNSVFDKKTLNKIVMESGMEILDRGGHL
ncbi:MAG: class I SAM-dependent methyltransferase [Butyrivibrio sp.]|nr:class I SAM-dependent methyltransferase [Butyrivibrio sp.]